MSGPGIQRSFSIPLEATLENTNMRAMKWLLYGPPGTGKTTLLNQAGGVLFLSTDGGTRFIKSLSRPVDNWTTFKKYVKVLTTERHSHISAVCVDTVDHIVTMCKKYVCDKRGIEHQSDEAYGKAYDLIEREFTNEILKLVAMEKGLFFVSHAQDKERKTRYSTLTKTEPTLKNPGWKILQPIMDIIAYMGFDGNSGSDDQMGRRVYFQPTESMEAKDRTKRLPESMFIPHPNETNGFNLIESYLLKDKLTDKKQAIVRKKIKLKKA